MFQLVDWWCKQLYDHCRVALADGVFVDQKWMDLVLSCVESSTLLRHPGYNAAYWNLPHRKISRNSAGEYLVNGEPLAFFHFSGFHPQAPRVVSKHQSRLSWGDIGKAAQSLYLGYEAKLTANGYRETSAWPYAYAAFGNGLRSPIASAPISTSTSRGSSHPKPTSSARRTMRSASERLPVAAVRRSPDGRRDGTLPPLSRPEAAFPDVPGKDALPYAHWFAEWEDGETRIEPAFVEPVRPAGRGGRLNPPLVEFRLPVRAHSPHCRPRGQDLLTYACGIAISSTAFRRSFAARCRTS